MAQELKKEGKERRIIIAGNPMKQEISIPLEYLQKVCDLPIDFRFGEGKTGLEENELAGVFNEAKYAMVFDNFKGFSRNSSAAMSLLANGLILFTNQGATTPACVLKGGENEGSVIFTKNDPAQVLGRIKQIEERSETDEIREKIDSFLNKYCSPKAIVSDFTKLLDPTMASNVQSAASSAAASSAPKWEEVEPLDLVLKKEILQSIMKATEETKEQPIKAQQVLQLLGLMRLKIEKDECLDIIDFCNDEIKKSINVFQQDPNYVDEDAMVDDEDITENEDTITVDENTSAVIDVIHDHFFKDLELCDVNLELLSNKAKYGEKFNEFFIPPLSQNNTMKKFFSDGSSDMDDFFSDKNELDIYSTFTDLVKQYKDFSSNVQQNSSSSSQNQVASITNSQKHPRAEDNFEAETEDKGISGTGVKTQKQSENSSIGAEDNFKAETEDKGISSTGAKDQKQTEYAPPPPKSIRKNIVNTAGKAAGSSLNQYQTAENSKEDSMDISEDSINNPPKPPPPPSKSIRENIVNTVGKAVGSSLNQNQTAENSIGDSMDTSEDLMNTSGDSMDTSEDSINNAPPPPSRSKSIREVVVSCDKANKAFENEEASNQIVNTVGKAVGSFLNQNQTAENSTGDSMDTSEDSINNAPKLSPFSF